MEKKALMMIALLLLPLLGLEAWAYEETYENSYVECSWDETTKSVVKTVKHFNYRGTYSESHPNQWIKLENEEHPNVQYWVFDGYKLEYQGIEVPAGEAQHIILLDNTQLRVQRIKLEAGATLHIHVQQGQNGDIGELIITGNTNAGAAGIGSSYGANAGDLIIHGGTISVDNPQTSAAGIGGGDGGEEGGGGNGGKVTIYDGTISVKASNKGAAIGGGHYGNGGDVKIYGGDITLQSGSDEEPTIGHGRDATNNGTVSFGLMRVYKGTRTEGDPTFANAPIYRTKRADLSRSSHPVHITSCTTHQCFSANCDHCGYHTDSPAGLHYLDRSWDETNKQVKEEIVTVYNARNMAEFLPFENQSTDYWVHPEFGYNKLVLYVMGDLDMSGVKWYDQYDTKLIICDDSQLKIKDILMNGPFVNLDIYGQQAETGKLIANQGKDSETGIGANGQAPATINIHSGRIEAYGGPGQSGIGTQSNDPTADKLYIYGGNIYAEGGPMLYSGHWYTAYGIGGEGMTTVIYDGQIEAHGGFRGAGIGYETTIYGGTIIAQGGDYGAGIGGGTNTKGGDLTIHGGTITATGGYRSAGIGGGYESTAGTVTITGGDVTARGADFAAGIGCGANQDTNHKFKKIEISGGNVRGFGGVDAAGIGGGEDGECEEIIISGGFVRAEGKGNAVGIGAGEDGDSHTITISGGIVKAKGGEHANSAIGSNLDSEHKGTLTLPDNYKVNAGTDEGTSYIERRFTNAERVPACFYRRYAEISECAHDVPTQGSDKTEARSYTIGEDNTHIYHCRYCNVPAVTEQHTWVNEVCDKCGKHFNAQDDEWKVSVYQAVVWPYEPYAGTLVYDATTKTTARVLKGDPFNVTTEQDVEGLELQAFVLNPATAPTEPWLTDAEKTSQAGFIDLSKPFVPTNDAKIYARYRHDFTTRWEWGTDAYGFIDGSNVKLYISNKWINDGEEFELTPQVVEDDWSNRENDDVIYTATVNYKFNDNVTYTFTDVKHTPYFLPSIELKKTENNYWTVNKYDGKTVDVKLTDRTLYHDGTWNTIYLPFALSAEQLADEACPLHGATIKKLEDCSFADGTLTLTFTENSLTETEAGTPYIVKWPASDNVTNPEFKKVTVSKDATVTTIVKDQTYGVAFMGSYNPTEITSDIVELRAMLYLGANNLLYYPNAPMTIGAQMAYFYLYGLTVGDLAQGANSIVLDFGDETTGVALIDNGKRIMDNDAWYTLDGRRLNGKPTQKGIYINNGKKIVMK